MIIILFFSLVPVLTKTRFVCVLSVETCCIACVLTFSHRPTPFYPSSSLYRDSSESIRYQFTFVFRRLNTRVPGHPPRARSLTRVNCKVLTLRRVVPWSACAVYRNGVQWWTRRLSSTQDSVFHWLDVSTGNDLGLAGLVRFGWIR